MHLVDDIRKKFWNKEYEFSKHAVDQSIIRDITVKEIQEAMVSCVLLEEYPKDKYGPSCLVLGFSYRKRPIHVQCSYPTRDKLKIITVYEPDENQWVDFRKRKKK